MAKAWGFGFAGSGFGEHLHSSDVVSNSVRPSSVAGDEKICAELVYYVTYYYLLLKGKLKMNDPATVVQELGSVEAKWEPTAVELGVQSTDLDAIKGESPEDGDEGYLQRVAHWWLAHLDYVY